MKNKLLIIVTILSILSLTACSTKKAITSENFKNYMEVYKYPYTDYDEEYGEDFVKNFGIELNSDAHILIIEANLNNSSNIEDTDIEAGAGIMFIEGFPDNKSAKQFCENTLKAFSNKSETETSTAMVQGVNFRTESTATQNGYVRCTAIDTTVCIGIATETNKVSTVDTIMQSMGY